ncbi:MAG TPA: TolC family protein [bacterium (Candidatus Stahlbacteria)]|nr:TolC family protein [Candidatus Stahlbacteria bacterium]
MMREVVLRALAYIIISSILICVLLNVVWGLSLDKLVNEALENNPEILAAKNKWEAAKAKVPQVRWWSDPQLGINYEKIPQGSYSLGEANMRMLSISQMIPFPGKLTLKGRMAKEEVLIAKENYEAKHQEIIAKVKSAYYRLFLVHKSIEIKNEEKELLRKFEKIAQTKYAVGQVPQHDVLRAQVELSLVADDLITLQERDLPTAEARLNAILNRPLHLPLGVPDEFTVPELKKSREEIEELALKYRQELKAMKNAIEKSKIAYNLAKMEYLPNFMVKFMQEEMRMPMSTEINRGVMFSLSIPLWFWNKGYRISERRAQKSSAKASYQAMKNMVLFEVQNALSKYNATQRRVNLFKTTIIPQAEQALKSATIAYKTGKIDFLTLINSERTLINAKLKYYKTLVEHGENLANLERVVGVTLSQ